MGIKLQTFLEEEKKTKSPKLQAFMANEGISADFSKKAITPEKPSTWDWLKQLATIPGKALTFPIQMELEQEKMEAEGETDPLAAYKQMPTGLAHEYGPTAKALIGAGPTRQPMIDVGLATTERLKRGPMPLFDVLMLATGLRAGVSKISPKIPKVPKVTDVGTRGTQKLDIPLAKKTKLDIPHEPEIPINIESYYKSISAPQKMSVVEAQKMGIALRLTKGGKVKPAIRQAGSFVPEEFALYKNFKDAKQGMGGGTKDITRFVQEIDGALPVQELIKMPGQAGPTIRNVLWRTRDMTKMKLNWLGKQQDRLSAITEGLSNKQMELATKILEETSRKGAYVETADFMTSPRIKNITTDIKIVEFAQNARKFLEHMFKEQNKMRVLRNQKEIPYRDYYAPDQLKRATIWSEAFGLDKKPESIIQKPQLPDYIKPNKPFNPRELAKNAGLPDYMREMNLGKMLADYANIAGKDIFNTSIIQNNKAFIQQLETMGYPNAARGLSDWTAEAFGGIGAHLDRAINPAPLIRRGMSQWRRYLIKTVFPLNWAWNLTIQTSSGVLTNMRAGSVSSMKGLYDWFGKPQLRKEIGTTAYSAIIKSQRMGKITHQDFNRGMSNAVRLRKSWFESAVDAANYVTELTEKHLTGWSVAAGLRRGAQKGLKGKALWEFASDMGSKTQSMYNLEDLPGMLRSETVKTAMPFQTFRFELYNTMKEFAGKTGMPPGTQFERMGWALRFMAGAAATNIIVKSITGREPWNIYTLFPFSEFYAKPIIDGLVGKDVRITGRELPSPVGVAFQFGKALNRYFVSGNKRQIRNWSLKYMPGLVGVPGGVQISRTVDGIIAIADEGMYDNTGRMLFPVTDTKEQMRSVFSGPWTTKLGQEYWEKREKSFTEIFKERYGNKKKKDTSISK